MILAQNRPKTAKSSGRSPFKNQYFQRPIRSAGQCIDPDGTP